jgi:hypothetical protein
MLCSARRPVARQNGSAQLSFAVAAFLTDSKSIHSTISIVLDYSTLLTVGCVSQAVEVGVEYMLAASNRSCDFHI